MSVEGGFGPFVLRLKAVLPEVLFKGASGHRSLATAMYSFFIAYADCLPIEVDPFVYTGLAVN